MPIQLRDEVSIAILDDLRRIVYVLRRSSRSAEQHLGVTGAQLYVLKTLCEHPAVSLNELAEATHTHQSTVSVVVRRLVDKRLVRRRTSATDARRLVLEPTPRGRAVFAKAPAAAQELLLAAIQAMPGKRRQTLAAGLRALTTQMRLTREQPWMLFEDDKPSARAEKPEARRGR